MATEQAIAAVCDGVVDVLRDNYRPAEFHPHVLEFKVASTTRDEEPIGAGVSLYLYRVFLNQAERAPAGRLHPDGRRARNQLPLDLHFLLTPWGGRASLRHLIAGWMMRTLEDHRVLEAGLLNRNHDQVFRPDETVEIVSGQIETEDLFSLWDLFGRNSYQLSVPYVAQNVRIESRHFVDGGEAVQDRGWQLRIPVGAR